MVSFDYNASLTFTGVDQYKYGKNRVEADAKKLQTKEEELMRKKQEIRNRLTQLKKDRKDLRTAIENNTGEDQLSQLNCPLSVSGFKITNKKKRCLCTTTNWSSSSSRA